MKKIHTAHIWCFALIFSGLSALESFAQESVSCAQLPNSVPSATSFVVRVPYVANQTREIAIPISRGNTWLGVGKKTVQAGSGTVDITVNVMVGGAPPAGNNYTLNVGLRPPGGGFNTNVVSCDHSFSITTGGGNNGGSGNESVSCAQLPNSVPSATSFVVRVPYVANQTREIAVPISRGNTWLGVGKKTVQAGSGTAEITVNIMVGGAPPAGNNYTLNVGLRPPGGGFNTNVTSCDHTFSITSGGGNNGGGNNGGGNIATGGSGNGRTIRLSQFSGDWKNRMTQAVNSASSGDIVLVDGNQTVNGPYVLKKAGLVIQGSNRNTLVKRNNTNNGAVLYLETNNTTIRNMTFQGGVRTLQFRGGATRSNVLIEDMTFLKAGYVSLNLDKCNVDKVTIQDCIFKDSNFQMQTFDCNRLTKLTIRRCTFNKGDHQLSLDNPYATNLNHQDIVIANNTFNVTKRFNIALAQTKNTMVRDNVMKGGTGGYSQCLHVEDRTANLTFNRNTMSNDADTAVIVYATDRIGHGDGRQLSNNEKPNYGSGPFSCTDNVAQNVKDQCVLIIYLKGQGRFFGTNRFNSNSSYAIQLSGGSNKNQLSIADSTVLKGRTWASLKNLSKNQRSNFVNF